ncbi:unnamed protein product [Lampetra fluviatilis]
MKKTPTHLQERRAPLKIRACSRLPNCQPDCRSPRAMRSRLRTAVSPNCCMLQPPALKKSTWGLRAWWTGCRRTFPPLGTRKNLNYPPEDHVLPPGSGNQVHAWNVESQSWHAATSAHDAASASCSDNATSSY